MQDIYHSKYPIGKFMVPENFTDDLIKNWITDIESFPLKVSDAVSNLSDMELNWKYRPGGWSIKQVVHHCADSHMNSFSRFKLALTEDTPKIKPYFEDMWALLADTIESEIIDSLKIIEGLHSRWVNLLRSLNVNQLKREFIHPEYGKKISLAENIALYAWHCNHHLAHINQAIENEGELIK